jgi:hypothetical protein
LKMLPCWLAPRLRRASLTQRNMRNARRASPTTEPITMPAIAPPEIPLEVPAAESEELAVAVDVGVLKVMVAVINGSFTLAHLVSASEL